MYKTIRHGENSLQYTILPQNDDFRLEGKIKSAGSSKKSKTKKPKRRSFFAYLGLLFVCTVIVGALLVPFLVSAECLNPTEWFLKTKAAFTKASPAEHKDTATGGGGNALANAMLNKGNFVAKASVGKSVNIINKDGVEKIILKVNKTATTSTPTTDVNPEEKNFSTDILPDKSSAIVSNSKSSLDIPQTVDTKEQITINEMKPFVTTAPPPAPETLNKETEATFKSLPVTTLSEMLLPSTTTTTTTLAPSINRPMSSVSLPNVPRASLQSSLSQSSNNSSSTQPTITTRIMQVPLLKSTAKKPAIPPVLVKNLSPIQPTPDNSNLNDIIPSKINSASGGVGGVKEAANSDWIHTHWPYIDPSTYFQWNGYKTEDSVLLPALLGFALIGVILIITVCLVARNKRTIVTSVRKRNRNDIEEAGAEDNTTLLTNTNLSDED